MLQQVGIMFLDNLMEIKLFLFCIGAAHYADQIVTQSKRLYDSFISSVERSHRQRHCCQVFVEHNDIRGRLSYKT